MNLARLDMVPLPRPDRLFRTPSDEDEFALGDDSPVLCVVRVVRNLRARRIGSEQYLTVRGSKSKRIERTVEGREGTDSAGEVMVRQADILRRASQRIGLQLQQTALTANAMLQKARRQEATEFRYAELSVGSCKPCWAAPRYRI